MHGATLTLARSSGRIHPVIGLWTVSLRDDLRTAILKDSVRRVSDYTARHTPAIADWIATPVDPFFNVNTPQDMRDACAMSVQIKGADSSFGHTCSDIET